MLAKVHDLIGMHTAGANNPSGGPPAAKRQRTASGGVGSGGGTWSEGEAVRLAAGINVKLEPSLPGQPPPFEGEMPAEIAAEIPWVFSHVEEGEPGAEGIAHVMNLPCALGSRRYPLFFLFGHVPLSSLLAAEQLTEQH